MVIDPGFALTQMATRGVAVDVTEGDAGSIWIASAGGFGPGTITHLGTGIDVPHGSEVPNALVGDGEGGVWATMPTSNQVVHISRDDVAQSWTAPTPHGSPVAAYDSGGYVYFVEQAAKRLGRIDQVTGDITDFPIPGAVTPTAISGIADADGSHHTVWVTDPGAGRVWVLGTDGALIGSVDSLGAVTDIQLLASMGGMVEGIASTKTSLLYFNQTVGSAPVELVGGRKSLTAMEASDGGVWMADTGSGSLLFFKDGSLTEYASRDLAGLLSGIAITEGRYVWTAVRGTGKLGRLDLQATRTISRIGGADRYEVSAQVAASKFSEGASTVFIASGEGFADALSVAPLAAQVDAPLLLTSRAALPPSVSAELIRLAPVRVVIVGGLNSVGADVESAIKAIAPRTIIMRIDGPDRYAVSRALLTGTFAPRSTSKLFITNGANFPDALSSGPAAAADGAGVLLVNGAGAALSAEELNLVQSLVSKNGTVEIVGGPNSVSAAIEAQIKSVRGVERNGGADRFEVSQGLNAKEFPRPAQVYLANGAAFADALSGAVAAGISQVPMYLSRQTCIPAGVAQGALAPSVGQVTLLGGTATLSPAVENLAVCP
ncbi:cell wall-binding repeat-containing protein [Herbiconiux sp.]|uniref:cell wall-binding repeat-containing protein n=1 Tax=Herbiconiux sp. TaxID=1871186 RepID=UPI0025BB9DF0|nr:cell wall-binding repeat-containing protein [Herbiconiux sp.]